MNRYWWHTGRWVEITLDIAIFPRHVFPVTYPLYLVALISAYFASLFSFLSSVLGSKVSIVHRMSLAAIFLALFITRENSHGETVFWVSGAVSSTLPVFCTVYLLGWLISAPVKPASRIRCASLAFSSLLVAGLHEMFALTLCVTLGTGLIATAATRDPHRRLWGAAFAGAALGTALVLVAPGNYVRVSAVDSVAHLASRLEIISYGGGLLLHNVLNHWLLDLKLVAATAFFAWHPAIRKVCPTWLRDFRLHGKVAILACWLLTTILPLFLPQLVLSRVFVLPSRTFDGLYAVFLMGWFGTVFVFTRPTYGSLEDEQALGRGTYRFASIVLAGALLQSPTCVAMYRDLRSNASPWKYALDERMRAIQAAKAENRLDLVVPSLSPVTPASYFYQDVIADPNDWRNKCVAKYFDLRTIVSR